MRESIFDRQAAKDIVRRISALAPDTPRRWGTMNATEMLRHCNVANEFILEATDRYAVPSLKQRLIKFIAINVLPRFPKNHKGPKRVEVRGMVDVAEFQSFKKSFIDIVTSLPERSMSVTALHPSMGYLTHAEWGIIIWMHMDHHLRQFGL